MWRSRWETPLSCCSRALPSWCHISCWRDKFLQAGRRLPSVSWPWPLGSPAGEAEWAWLGGTGWGVNTEWGFLPYFACNLLLPHFLVCLTIPSIFMASNEYVNLNIGIGKNPKLWHYQNWLFCTKASILRDWIGTTPVKIVNSYVRHLPVHTGNFILQRDYKCEVCGKSLSYGHVSEQSVVSQKETVMVHLYHRVLHSCKN